MYRFVSTHVFTSSGQIPNNGNAMVNIHMVSEYFTGSQMTRLVSKVVAPFCILTNRGEFQWLCYTVLDNEGHSVGAGTSFLSMLNQRGGSPGLKLAFSIGELFVI